MVRLREGPQHPGDGPARSLTGGPLQLLLAPVHDQDCSHAGRSVFIASLALISEFWKGRLLKLASIVG